MLRRSVFVAAMYLVGALACNAEFAGWEGMRVIEQKGRPYLMKAADLDGDSREELIVVNSRSSRLDIYAWRDAGNRPQPEAAEAMRPNELPQAVEFDHTELQLEQVPRDVLVYYPKVDGPKADGPKADATPMLVVLVASPNQVLVYGREGDRWTKQATIDLLEGDIPSRREAMLWAPGAGKSERLLVSMDNGIQEIELKAGTTARWTTPREKRGRLDWWLADLDGDGLDDLVEQTRESNESIRWHRGQAAGTFAPAGVLHDRSVKDVELLRTGATAELAVIDGSVGGILRRYRLGTGKQNPFGVLRPLALEDGSKAVWCGMRLGERPTLVVADGDSPRFLCYGLGDSGWLAEKSYPAVTNIRALAQLASEPGALLVWTKDGADLRISRWNSDRLTYPEPWQQAEETDDRKILALGAVGELTWWAQKVGKDLDLYVARPAAMVPSKTRFEGIGGKADQVLWLGGQRLLVKETHGRALNLIEIDGEEVKASSPSHLKKATLAEFKQFSFNGTVRVGRLKDGVLQWLGADLRSTEQVMLPQGQQLADYVMESETRGWALQGNSPFVHRIEIDDARLSRSAERIKVDDGDALVHDTSLGMLLVGSDRVTHLSAGQSTELQLIDIVDERVARSGGVKKTRFHRLGATDIDGDGYSDLVLFDELQHRVTVLGFDAAKQEGEALVPKISWPVFDDKVYPYTDQSDNLVKEPRAVLAADFDGDKMQDLAILCHDRLLLYLAKEQ